eukprot:1159652-Pelagomonas_calceolata.AAC.23
MLDAVSAFETRRWVDSICNNWDFNKVIPCHFDGPIPAKPADVKRAFTFAYEMTEDLDEESKPAKNGGVLGWFTSLFKKEEKLQENFRRTSASNNPKTSPCWVWISDLETSLKITDSLSNPGKPPSYNFGVACMPANR